LYPLAAALSLLSNRFVFQRITPQSVTGSFRHSSPLFKYRLGFRSFPLKFMMLGSGAGFLKVLAIAPAKPFAGFMCFVAASSHPGGMQLVS
jgi:hypothetical protein